MALSRDEIYKKVQGVMVDALGVDEEEVTPEAKLSADLGAESIDYLDIVFRLEKAFTTDPTKPFKIPRGELFPEDLATMQNDPKFVQDGKITADGMAELKKRMPYTDFTEFERDPQVEKAQDLLTVDTVTNYIAAKLNG
ncbi:MAG TPA: phosphopantetheine-binding protein [Tepidisphaeraceae bacterium]|nr:phosphopantetheine-binding protein [Tepidisphaeraceae bacterium]